MKEAFPPVVSEQQYKFFAASLAEARFDAGMWTDALALVDQALSTGEGPANGLYVPEIHRLRGVFLKGLVAGKLATYPPEARGPGLTHRLAAEAKVAVTRNGKYGRPR